jgi:hypothetical protein
LFYAIIEIIEITEYSLLLVVHNFSDFRKTFSNM